MYAKNAWNIFTRVKHEMKKRLCELHPLNMLCLWHWTCLQLVHLLCLWPWTCLQLVHPLCLWPWTCVNEMLNFYCKVIVKCYLIDTFLVRVLLCYRVVWSSVMSWIMHHWCWVVDCLEQPYVHTNITVRFVKIYCIQM